MRKSPLPVTDELLPPVDDILGNRQKALAPKFEVINYAEKPGEDADPNLLSTKIKNFTRDERTQDNLKYGVIKIATDFLLGPDKK